MNGSLDALEEDISIHIFTVSAGLVGVCLTVIGVLRIVISIRKADLLADDLLALDALLFLISSLCSYWSLRTRTRRRMLRLERFTDAVFMLGMLLMVGVCVFIPFAISIS